MCGIAGAFFWRETTASREAANRVQAMTRTMVHRGPDGQGVVTEQGARVSVALGHRRLAIIDLSERGAQPMRSHSAPLWLTFNGEIYNFVALRRELEGLGREFVSGSDSEVILQGYEAWGESVVERLSGMFAFGLYDGRSEQLLLARDRVGVKPLYVHASSEAIYFASEVRALLASGAMARHASAAGLQQYLAYQTVPGPNTLVEGVQSLEPGTLLRVDHSGRHHERRYWDLLAQSARIDVPASIEDARAEVGRRLYRSIEGHLVSDVPVGTFLSGGIDSSAIVALVRGVGATPRTFSVVLPGTAHDEAPFSRLVADRFGAEHTEVVLSESELAGRVPDALAALDHPTGDGVNTYIVSRAVHAAGIKVALSGLGGDEIFGGYPSFRRLRRLSSHAAWWRRSPASVRGAAAAIVRAIGRDSVGSGKVAALLEADGSVAESFPILRQMFSPRERAALMPQASGAPMGDPYVDLLRTATATHPDRDVMALVSYAEARTYMHDVLLRDSDQMSMASSLELRVPLLDHPLVEYVVGLPERFKSPDLMSKRLLVESVGAVLPSEAVDRPKRGFVLPFDTWMRGELRPLCEHHLFGAAGVCALAGFSRAAVDRLWTDYLAGTRRTSWSRPWTLVALGAWLERQGVTA